MPIAVVRSLALPVLSTTRVTGVAGAARANVHAAVVEIAGMNNIVEVVALGDEAIVGRDLANR